MQLQRAKAQQTKLANRGRQAHNIYGGQRTPQFCVFICRSPSKTKKVKSFKFSTKAKDKRDKSREKEKDGDKKKDRDKKSEKKVDKEKVKGDKTKKFKLSFDESADIGGNRKATQTN